LIVAGLDIAQLKVDETRSDAVAANQMTKRPPFVVLKVLDLYDANGVMQGLSSYANEIVAERDVLNTVNGSAVTEAQNLQLLAGPIGSLVEMGFLRAATQEEYAIKVQRYAARSTPMSCSGENPPSVEVITPKTITALEVRIAQLEKDKFQLELERQEAEGQCREMRKQIEGRAGVMEGKQLDLDREKQAVSLSRQQSDETAPEGENSFSSPANPIFSLGGISIC